MSTHATHERKTGESYASGVEPSQWLWNRDGLLTAEEAARMQRMLNEINKARSVTVAVFVIRGHESLEPPATLDITQLTNELYDAMCGRPGFDRNNGLVLAYFHRQRGYRQRAGLGLLHHIIDSRAQHIQSQYIMPEFRQGKIAMGLTVGIQEQVALIPFRSTKADTSTEAATATKATAATNKQGGGGWWSDFKNWNRSMYKGQRSVGVTALWGAGVGAGVYYGCQAAKWLFWAGVISFVGWRAWKWGKTYVDEQKKRHKDAELFHARQEDAANQVLARIRQDEATRWQKQCEEYQRQLKQCQEQRKEDERKRDDGQKRGPAVAAAGAVGTGAAAAAAATTMAFKAKQTKEEEKQTDADEREMDLQMRLSRLSRAQVFEMNEMPDTGFWRVSWPKPEPAAQQVVPEPKAKTEVPGVIKAAAMGSGDAVSNREFQQFRAEERQKVVAANAAILKALETTSTGSTWASTTSPQRSSSGSSWGGGNSSRGTSGGSWGSGSSSSGSSGSSGSSW
jgi:uncharacterized membrane protein YgcG